MRRILIVTLVTLAGLAGCETKNEMKMTSPGGPLKYEGTWVTEPGQPARRIDKE